MLLTAPSLLNEPKKRGKEDVFENGGGLAHPS
jgi:hypothetical protein